MMATKRKMILTIERIGMLSLKNILLFLISKEVILKRISVLQCTS